MSFNISGKVHHIGSKQTFNKGFTKKEFVVQVEGGKYPQFIKFDFIKEKIDLIQGIRLGSDVKVYFNIRGSEYNDKYYVNLEGWKVEVETQEAPEMNEEVDF